MINKYAPSVYMADKSESSWSSWNSLLLILPFALLFFPSITFGVVEAEVFPWAIIISVIYLRRYNVWMLLFISYLSISALMTAVFTDNTFEVMRSFSAYLNAILAFELILSLSSKYILQTLLLARFIFFLLISIGIFQYYSLIDVVEPVIKFLVPRASSSSLSFIGRGVTLLSSEPARAGVELIFIYIVVKTVFITHRYRYVADLLAIIYLLLIIQSSMALMLFSVYIVLTYRAKVLFILIFGIILIPFFEVSSLSGRSIDLIMAVTTQSSFSDAMFLLMNTSGHRVVSIFSSYYYGVCIPFGGGVGNWMVSSIDALNITGIDLSTLNYFKLYGNGGPVSIRSSGYIANLMVDVGIAGTSIFIYYVYKRIKKYSDFFVNGMEIIPLFVIKILFVGSVGTPVAFICTALCIKYIYDKNNPYQVLPV